MTLVRSLRKWDLVALVINNVIGAGIFGLPSQVYALAGTLSLAAYAIAALAVGLIVLCFAEVGSRFDAAGGPYLYTRVTFGRLIGFQVGWLMWIARLAGFAALINLFVTYLAFFVPHADSGVWRTAAILLIVTILSTVNIVGVRATATMTNVLTIGKVIPLFVLVAIGLFFVDPNRQASAVVPSYGSFSRATLLLLYAYVGFEGAVIPGGEMRDPQRHLPFALLVGMSVVAVLYIGLQAVCIGTVPDLAHASRPLADAAFHIVGRGGESLIAAVALISIGGILNATTFATSRLVFAIAENGELPRMFAWTHARFRTPVAAIVATATIAATFALYTTFISALTIATIVRLVTYMVTCVALPALRRRSDVPAPAFWAPAGWLVSAGAVGLGVWLLSNTAWAELRLGAVAVMLGMAIYLSCTRRTRASEAAVLSSRPS
jgi:basic amino acid/polyamine antiporter, APA family